MPRAPISLASLASLALLGVACGSEPLDDGVDTMGGSPGAGGEAGAPTEPNPDLPDYATSPCWGESAITEVYDGVTHVVSEKPAVCRGEGERALVYVAEELWGGAVTQAHVNGFLHRLELVGGEGSYREDLGILPTNEEVFGAIDTATLPGGKLPIFVIDTNDAGDGYLCGWCDSPEIHLDGTVLRPLSGETALSIVSHESFHVIHRGFDRDETQWVDESLAEAAMTVNGFFTDQSWLEAFLADPNVNWGPGNTDTTRFQYGAGLLWGTFLWERGGPELMRALTREATDGWEGLDAALLSTGRGGAFRHFLEMAVGLYLDDPSTGYGFEAFDFDNVLAVTDLEVGASESVAIQPYGLTYFRFGAGAESVLVNVEDPAIVHAWWIATEPASGASVIPDGEWMSLEAGGVAMVITATAAASAEISLR